MTQLCDLIDPTNNFITLNQSSIKMKTILSKFSLLASLLVFFNANLSAQSLLEQSGGVKTDFVFIQAGDTIPVTDQILIQRGYSVSSSDYKRDENNAYGYASAYGLQAYCIEFITTTDFKTLGVYDKKRLNYLVKMISKDGTVLFSRELYRNHFTFFTTGENGIQLVSFNLKGLPIIMLDQTQTISIDIVD